MADRTYVRAPVRAPRLSGTPLRAMVAAIESRAGAPLLDKLVADSGIEAFRASDPGHASPVQVPLRFDPSVGAPQQPRAALAEAALAAAPAPGDAETVARFRDAYRSGATSPVDVLERVERAVAAMDTGPGRMAFFISRRPDEARRQAEASAERWRRGEPLSPLDGVPVVIKDELDQEGVPTTLGTRFLATPARQDSTVVARLRAAGAMFVGKANMHEIGINPIGVNPHHGACRNPYDRTRITGGSSSGSAATVAAGLAPVSIGADGGGSVRIPAALCGVVGLKATWGRISEAGVPALCWNPGHVGPLGATVADVAALYACIAGPDEADAATWRQPPVHLTDLADGSLAGLRIGLSTPYFEDADAAVVERCREAVAACVVAGARIVELPPPDLNTLLWSHAIIILSEMAEAMLPHTRVDSARFGADARTNLAIGRHFRATDLVHAMRHRQRLTVEALRTFESVDVIVTPTTASTAPAIPEEALPGGESNLPVVDALMRFIRLGNLTGFPGLSVPAGFDGAGLPVGVHFLGRPYEEHLLLRVGRVVEASAERRTPRVFTRLLAGG